MEAAGIPRVTAEEVKGRIDRGDELILVDVRKEAVSAPPRQTSSRCELPKENKEETLGGLQHEYRESGEDNASGCR